MAPSDARFIHRMAPWICVSYWTLFTLNEVYLLLCEVPPSEAFPHGYTAIAVDVATILLLLAMALAAFVDWGVREALRCLWLGSFMGLGLLWHLWIWAWNGMHLS